MKAGLRKERGASAVEFALILPVLVIILFGIIEFGLLLYNKQVITNAGREAARAGIVAQSPRMDCAGDPSVMKIVQDYCAGRLITFGPPNVPVVSCTPDPTSSASFGDDLTVNVNYSYNFLLIPSFVPSLANGINLNAVTVMRYE